MATELTNLKGDIDEDYDDSLLDSDEEADKVSSPSSPFLIL